MASIPELMDGHITLEVECLGRLYLNGYIGRLATPGGLVTFMRDQPGKPIPSPVVSGQITEKFREAHATIQKTKCYLGQAAPRPTSPTLVHPVQPSSSGAPSLHHEEE